MYHYNEITEHAAVQNGGQKDDGQKGSLEMQQIITLLYILHKV